MSVQNVNAFIEKAQKEQGLQQELRRIPQGNEDATIRGIVKLGEKWGFHFSEQDYRSAVKSRIQSGEISEKDLAKVSGGTLTAVTMVTTLLCPSKPF